MFKENVHYWNNIVMKTDILRWLISALYVVLFKDFIFLIYHDKFGNNYRVKKKPANLWLIKFFLRLINKQLNTLHM